MTESVEREHELGEIREVLSRAKGGEGLMLAVEGPPGIGKTRLLDASRRIAAEEGMDVLHARGGELERNFAFGVTLGLFEARVAQRSGSVADHLLRGRAALAAPLLIDEDHDRPATTSDEFALLHGLYWCVVNLSERRPLAIVVDDVHWADDLSLRFLHYVAQRLEDLPTALIVAITTGDPTTNSELVSRLGGAASVRLRPDRLSLAGAEALFQASDLPISLGREVVYASWEATGGNPFLLGELIAAIRADPGSWTGSSPSDVAAFAPHSVRRAMMLRLSRYGDSPIALARACSVLGAETPLPRAAELASLGTSDALDAAGWLVGGGIMNSVDPLTFAHPMIRSAVYGDLQPGERARAHVDAARLLHRDGAVADEIARHLLAGAPTPEEWARAALHEGARTVARKGAPKTAVNYLRRALLITPTEERQPGMLVDLGVLEAAAGETTSLDRFEEALVRIQQPEDQARALYALGQTLYRYGRHSDAAHTFRKGAEFFDSLDSSLALRFEAAYICVSQFVSSLHVEAMERLEEIVGRDAGPIPEETEQVLLANLSVYRAGTRPHVEDHAKIALRALGDGSLLRLQTSESMAVNIAIAGLIFCGALDDAEDAVDSVIADARGRGAALAFAEASMMRAMVMHARGQISDAMADAQVAIDGRARGWAGLIPIPQAILAQCLFERGEYADAEQLLDGVELILPGPDASYLNAWFHHARARIHLFRREFDASLFDAQQIQEDLEPYNRISPAFAPWRSLAALSVHGLGDEDRAMELVGEEVALSRDFGLDLRLGAALRVRALFEDGDEALNSLEESISTLTDAGSPLELARSLHDLGRALRHAGRRVASREPLTNALDLAHTCGASVLAESTRDELHASGARPRRQALGGVDSLTPSELRVARLAVKGRTNRNIAETLFLTKNTVDWHLRNIYRKLAISSREELGGKLGKES